MVGCVNKALDDILEACPLDLHPMKRRTLIAAAPTLLSACAATSSIPDGTRPGAGQGILAVRLSANCPGTLYFDPVGKSMLGSGSAEWMYRSKSTLQFIEGECFVVVLLDAGLYTMRKLTFGDRYAWLSDPSGLLVLDSTICYAGHIDLFVSGTRFGLNVSDREAAMLGYLQSNYPIYSQSMRFKKTISMARLQSG